MEIIARPKVVGTARCTVSMHHVFDLHFGDAPCTNCRRDFCAAHAAKEPESNLTSGLCAECGEAYLAEGMAGFKRVQERLLRVYGS